MKVTNVFSIDTFSDRLKELRGERTLQEVSDAIGITRVAMGYYEKGERKPDVEMLYKIADYYKVPADYLIGLSDVKSPDIDIKSISDKTGLTENAIKKILSRENAFLNCLLNSEEFGNMDYLFHDIDFNYGLAAQRAINCKYLEAEAKQYPDDQKRQQEIARRFTFETDVIDRCESKCDGASYRLWSSFGKVLEQFRSSKIAEVHAILKSDSIPDNE